MLELRPSCEHCTRPLPPASPDARICSFECTFCSSCVEQVLHGVCPNCGGDLVRRPVRPARTWKGGNSLDRYPASTTARHHPVDALGHADLVAVLRPLPPSER